MAGSGSRIAAQGSWAAADCTLSHQYVEEPVSGVRFRAPEGCPLSCQQVEKSAQNVQLGTVAGRTLSFQCVEEAIRGMRLRTGGTSYFLSPGTCAKGGSSANGSGQSQRLCFDLPTSQGGDSRWAV